MGEPSSVNDSPATAREGDDAPVLALVRDLIFATRITATAGQIGATVKVVRDPAKLPGEQGRRLLVDLNLAGAIEAAADWGRATGRPVTGFVSHVDKPTIDAARSAGITQVLARSQFVQVLPDLLKAGKAS